MLNHYDFLSIVNRLRKTKPNVCVDNEKLCGFDVAVLLSLKKLAQSGEESVKVSTLANTVGMKKSAFSKALAEAEDRGFVKRANSVKDRREVYVSLTEKGEDFAQKVHKIMCERHEKFVERMGEKDMAELLRVLNKAVDIWEELND